MIPVLAFDSLIEFLFEAGSAVIEVLSEVDWEMLLGLGVAMIGGLLVFDELDKRKLQEKLPTLIEKNPEMQTLLHDKLKNSTAKKKLSELKAKVSSVSDGEVEGKRVKVVEVKVIRKDTGASKTLKVAAKSLSKDVRDGVVLYN